MAKGRLVRALVRIEAAREESIARTPPHPSFEPPVRSSEERVKISAVVRNAPSRFEVLVSTAGAEQSLAVPAKHSGQGSNVSGGEFLMLALATCYCNDLYREAGRLGVPVESVEVVASAEFPGVGLAATNIAYRATVSSPAPAAEIAKLLQVTDAVAEIHNTIRAGARVTWERA